MNNSSKVMVTSAMKKNKQKKRIESDVNNMHVNNTLAPFCAQMVALYTVMYLAFVILCILVNIS